MVKIFIVRNPFEPDQVEEREFPRGASIAAACGDFTAEPWLCVAYLDGERSYPLREEWSSIIPQDGDCIWFLPRTNGIVTLAIIAVTAVAVAVTIATKKPNIPSIKQPVQPSLSAANLTPEVASVATPEADPVFNLSGQRNQTRLGSPIEDAYGRCRLWPSYATRAYNQFYGNDQYQFQLFCLGHGSFDVETPNFEDTPFTNFAEVEYEFYGPDEVVTLFPDNVETSDEVGGIELYGPNEDDFADHVGPFAANAAGTTTTHLEIDITLPAGLYYSNNAGGLSAVHVEALFEYREIDDLGAPVGAGTWSELKDFQLTLATVTPQRLTYQKDVPAGRYEVRAIRTNNASPNSRVGDTIEWTTLRAFLTPTRVYGDVTMLAVKARATNNLNDRSSNKVNVYATRKLPVFVGGEIAAPDDLGARVATRNPIYAMINILRADYAGRIEDRFLDLDTLEAEAAAADADGVTFDWVYEQRSTLWEAVKLSLFPFRSEPILSGSKISTWRDQPNNFPSFHIGAENTFQNSFIFERKLVDFREHDGLEVAYVDPLTWKPETVLCLLPGQLGDNPKKLKAHGVTDRQRAYDLGMDHWARGYYEREQVTLTTGLEGHIPTYGDLGRISSDVPRWGTSGHLLDISGAVATLSEPVEFEDGKTYQLAVRGRKGQDLGPYTVTAGANTFEVTLAGSPDLSQIVFDDQSEPPFFIFGESVNVGRVCRVASLSPGDDGESVRLVAIVDDQRRFADYGTAPAPGSAPVPPAVPDAPVVTGLTVQPILGSLAFVTVAWEPAVGAVNYILEQSTDGVNFETVDTIAGTSYTLPVSYGTRWVRVAAVNVSVGPFATWTGTVGEATGVPGDVTGLIASPAFTGAFCAIQWDDVSDATSYLVEVWTDGVLRYSEEVEVENFTWTIELALANSGVDREPTFEVYGRNDIGDSTTAATLTPLNPIPAVPTSPASVLKSTGASSVIYTLSWGIVSGTDISRYRVYGSTTSSFTPGPSNLLFEGLASSADIEIEEGGGYVDLYWVVTAVDLWGDDINPTAEQTIELAPSSLLTGLVSVWDENGADLVGSNDLTGNNSPGTGTGKVNATCIDLERGSSQNYVLADASAGDLEGNQDLAFAFWCKPETLTNYVAPFGKTSTNNYRMYVSSVGDLVLEWGGRSHSVSGAFTNGTWTHIYVFWDNSAGQLTLSIDNATALVSSTGGTGAANADDFYLGTQANVHHWDGLIDQFAVWDRALTTDERDELYNSGTGFDFLA